MIKPQNFQNCMCHTKVEFQNQSSIFKNKKKKKQNIKIYDLIHFPSLKSSSSRLKYDIILNENLDLDHHLDFRLEKRAFKIPLIHILEFIFKFNIK